MTIRNRLIVAAFVSSAVVAIAASTSTCFLYRASSYLNTIHTQLVPAVNYAGEIEETAGELAQTMEDFEDAKAAGDSAAERAADGQIGAEFSSLYSSVKFLTQFINSFGENEYLRPLHAELDRLKQVANALESDWSRLREVGPGHPESSPITEFDDDAIRLARSATQLQGSVLAITASRIDTANSYIIWVSRLSAIIAVCMSILTLVTGMNFASSLAKRLIRVRDQTQIVGCGNLDTVLEVRGRDEIDDIALSFNGMVKALRGSRDKLERDALYDGLTGLPNRTFFMQQLSRCVAEAGRFNGHPYVLLFLDVDRFKQVNDTLGHAAGDELLREVAVRMSRAVHTFLIDSASVKTIARLAGDEFTILLECNLGPDEVASLGRNICGTIAEPMNIGGEMLTITVSVGIAMGEADVKDPKQILTRADVALYHTKRQGRDGFSLYAISMEDEGLPSECLIHTPKPGIRARRDAETAAHT